MGKPSSNVNESVRWAWTGVGALSGGEASPTGNSIPNIWSGSCPIFWMQSCVDYQVGQVLGTTAGSTSGLAQYPAMGNNTVIVFTSDHGDYGGSHGLHAKGGAAYDEAINVPFYVSYPSMRSNASMTAPLPLTYTCSSVDVLPFLYSLALGNEFWRSNATDMIYYLSGRESILDAIFKSNYPSLSVLQQRRLSSIPMAVPGNGADYEIYQPFVLHTADDFNLSPSDVQAPPHVIAFRTVDETHPNTESAPFYPANSYGGGKLVTYSYWDTCGQMAAPIMATSNASAPNQYEFYNYSPMPHVGTLPANPQETGNQMFVTPGGSNTLEAGNYVNDFFGFGTLHGNNVQNELYNLNTGSGPGNNTQQVEAAIQVAYQNYRTYLITSGTSTGSNGSVGSC